MIRNKPMNIFAEYIDGAATAQFYDAMAQDYSVAGALMPDAHKGYGLPIGGVVATKGMVVPSWVGYDIGCGMCAIMTSYDTQDVIDNGQEIFDRILEAIPVGFKHHQHAQVWKKQDQYARSVDADRIFDFKNGLHQMGTLGGGNHFIEIGVDENDMVWVIIHSGSRGVGHAIAQHYMKIAGGGKAREGHYPLSTDSKEGADYWEDLNYMLEFALENRCQMLSRIEEIMTDVCYAGMFKWDTMINRNHNHATFKSVEGLGDVIIHRKGATHAEEGMMGVIPGNMKDGSFIVRGKGNPESLFSSSHGAGRVLGRAQAKRELDTELFVEEMKNIVSCACEDTLDESPAAYKDIFKVMKEQEELVEIVAHVRPLINIKSSKG